MRAVAGGLYDLVIRTEMVLQQLQYAEACVRCSRVPIHHRHARELGGIADQLGLTGDINPLSCKLTENVSVHCSRKIPIALRDATVALGLTRQDRADFIYRGPSRW